MLEVVLHGIAAAYEGAVRERLRTPWRLTVLPEDSGPAAVTAAFGRADAVVLTRLDRSMPLGPRVRLVQVGGAGLDAVDLEAIPPRDRGLQRLRPRGRHGRVRDPGDPRLAPPLPRDDAASFAAGSWRFSGHIGDPPHGEAAGAVLGIVGLGRIGRAIARRARALGLRG
jgi:lactate dehydrogenase-like 2-hydroxyacid dehydrogenase